MNTKVLAPKLYIGIYNGKYREKYIYVLIKNIFYYVGKELRKSGIVL